MSENKEIPIIIDGKRLMLALGRCGISMFRHENDKDYLDVWEEVGTEDDPKEEHHWLFGRREMCLWMGGVALTREDQRLMSLSERENGPFPRHSGGWQPPVMVEDRATEFETEMYTRALLTDLESAEGPPIEFLNDE